MSTMTKMPHRMQAKVNVIAAAHDEWQRGAINEGEYLRRADITDEQHKQIENGLSRFSEMRIVIVRIANVIFPR